MANVTDSLNRKATLASIAPVAISAVAGLFMSQGAMMMLELARLPQPLVWAGGAFMGVLALGGGLLVAKSARDSFKIRYNVSVANAVNRYANTLPAEEARSVKKQAASGDPVVMDGLMKKAGYAAGFSALLGVANSSGAAGLPSTMTDINGVSYSNTGAAQEDFMDSGFSSHKFHEPSVNIDGSPMMGGIDIHGNPYGVTSD